MAANPRFLELLESMKQTHIDKNSGYAGKNNPDTFANFRESERFGVSAFLGCMTRLSDKFIRVCNLIRDPSNEKVGEKLTDTLIDLANYCLIAICLWEEKKEKV